MPSIISPPPYSTSQSQRNSNHILFIGNGAYPPNKEALDFIRDYLAPRLPLATFHVVGRLTKTYDGAKPNIIGYGMVDDISDITNKVGFGIAPLKMGSGLKIKVMTYLSAGLPVLGTKTALQGYEPSPALIEAELSNFDKKLSEQIKNYNADMHHVARKEYLDKYHSDSSIGQIVDIYKRLKYDAVVTASNSNTIEFDSDNLPWLKEFRESRYPICKEVIFINFDPKQKSHAPAQQLHAYPGALVS